MQAKAFHDDLQDVIQRVTDIDGQLVTSTLVGGLPESAREQLDKFMVSNYGTVMHVNSTLILTFIRLKHAVRLNNVYGEWMYCRTSTRSWRH